MDDRVTEQAAALTGWFPGEGPIVVAYSGGVDSALVLAAAIRACGPTRVSALIADSPSLPRSELQAARELAEELGAPVEIVTTDELSSEGYRRNAGDRCYFCKSALYSAAFDVSAKRSAASYASLLVDGTNLDDLSADRPGLRAAAEAGVRHPLAECRLRKEDVRKISSLWNLPTWNKPALACLASRVPVGTEVTQEKLERIEAAEDVLRRHGFAGARVRLHELEKGSRSPTDASEKNGESAALLLARLELSPTDLVRALENGVRCEIVRGIREAGFSFVTLDLEGYRLGGSVAS